MKLGGEIVVKKEKDSRKRGDTSWFLVYISFGLLLINLTLYAAYYSTSPIWISGDIVFLYKITADSFPVYGFLFSLVPTSTACPIVYLATKKIDRFAIRCLVNTAAIALGSMFSFTFLPFSMTLALSYIGLAGVVLATTLIRHLFLTLPQIVVLETAKSKEANRDIARDSIKLAHDRLLVLFRDSIWMIITLFAAGVSGLLIYQINVIGFFPPITENPLPMIFYRWQTVLMISLLLYYVGGFFLGVTLHIHKRLLELERALQDLLE